MGLGALSLVVQGITGTVSANTLAVNFSRAIREWQAVSPTVLSKVTERRNKLARVETIRKEIEGVLKLTTLTRPERSDLQNAMGFYRNAMKAEQTRAAAAAKAVQDKLKAKAEARKRMSEQQVAVAAKAAQVKLASDNASLAKQIETLTKQIDQLKKQGATQAQQAATAAKLTVVTEAAKNVIASGKTSAETAVKLDAAVTNAAVSAPETADKKTADEAKVTGAKTAEQIATEAAAVSTTPPVSTATEMTAALTVPPATTTPPTPDSAIKADESFLEKFKDWAWPEEEPIYKRPGLWVGVAVAVGGYLISDSGRK